MKELAVTMAELDKEEALLPVEMATSEISAEDFNSVKAWSTCNAFDGAHTR